MGARSPARKPDGGLRALFHRRLKEGCQWTAIETGLVAAGVPDSEFCFENGRQGWIEFKQARHWRVTFRPGQVPWIDRRARLGGNVWVAVQRAGGELWLVPGSQAVTLNEGGLQAVFGASSVFFGGPSRWPWATIRGVVTLALPQV